MDNAICLGFTRDFPSKPMSLIISVSLRNPSISSKLVNTVSQHCTPAALAAMIMCCLAPISSTPVPVIFVCRSLV